ncbi:unnamed protein product, partial [Vitis vinifera]
MMNGFALFLAVSSLVAASIWSPNPDQKQKDYPGAEEVIVKEGTRVVVVEYDKEGPGNTKVSISTQEAHHVTPKELICDAFGKCKEKIATKIGRSEQKVSEKVHEIQEGAKETYGKAKEKVIGNVEEKLSQKVHDIQDEVKDAYTKTKEKVVYDVVNYMLSTDAIGSLTCVIHILGFATAYGVRVWVTFFSSFVLAGALPNQQFAIVQSKIYPFYFKTMASCVGLALLGHALSQGEKVLLGKPDLFQGHALLATLHIILINLLYLEPRATKVMFERIRVENEERKGQESSRVEPGKEGEPTTGASDPQVMGRLDQETVNNQILELNEMLKKLNAYSSLLNILTLMVLKLHLVYLAHRLYMTC